VHRGTENSVRRNVHWQKHRQVAHAPIAVLSGAEICSEPESVHYRHAIPYVFENLQSSRGRLQLCA
jgi:hypothetical protein